MFNTTNMMLAVAEALNESFANKSNITTLDCTIKVDNKNCLGKLFIDKNKDYDENKYDISIIKIPSKFDIPEAILDNVIPEITLSNISDTDTFVNNFSIVSYETIKFNPMFAGHIAFESGHLVNNNLLEN